MAAWIHVVSFVISITMGWIDIIPGTGPVSISLQTFWPSGSSSQHELTVTVAALTRLHAFQRNPIKIPNTYTIYFATIIIIIVWLVFPGATVVHILDEHRQHFPLPHEHSHERCARTEGSSNGTRVFVQSHAKQLSVQSDNSTAEAQQASCYAAIQRHGESHSHAQEDQQCTQRAHGQRSGRSSHHRCHQSP